MSGELLVEVERGCFESGVEYIFSPHLSCPAHPPRWMASVWKYCRGIAKYAHTKETVRSVYSFFPDPSQYTTRRWLVQTRYCISSMNSNEVVRFKWIWKFFIRNRDRTTEATSLYSQRFPPIHILIKIKTQYSTNYNVLKLISCCGNFKKSVIKWTWVLYSFHNQL